MVGYIVYKLAGAKSESIKKFSIGVILLSPEYMLLGTEKDVWLSIFQTTSPLP